MDGFLWGLMIVGGPILLGLAIFLFGARRRKLNRVERNIADQQAQENRSQKKSGRPPNKEWE
jgi:hypothetical protein